MTKSYMQTEKECYVCRMKYGHHNPNNLHEHHIFEGWGNRRISEEMGAKVWLCGFHHNMSNHGVHFDKALDLEIKKEAQRKFEESHTHEEFMALIGRNYL